MKSPWFLWLLSSLAVGQSVSVTIQSQWCGLGEPQNETLTFRCSPTIDGARSKQCRQFAAVLRAARSTRKDDSANRLGITPEWLATNVDDAIKKDLPQYNGRPSPQQITLFQSAFLDPASLSRLTFSWHTGDYPKVRVEARIGQEIQASLETDSQFIFMAPWFVRIGGEIFAASDRSVAEALCPLLPKKKFPNRARICGT